MEKILKKFMRISLRPERLLCKGSLFRYTENEVKER